MPDEKLHNSKLAPYTSIDKTFQCLSYNLFKGDKPNMSRYETQGPDRLSTPTYTKQYLDQMEKDLNKFSSLHHGYGFERSGGKGKVSLHGIRGLYTPMAILRRGKDIMRKFMWDEGGDITEDDNDAWKKAKPYQELFTFKFDSIMDITTAWLDGKKDGDRDIFNLKINGDNTVVYNIWFQYFKCMFMSYLGEDWDKHCQLIEHPKYDGIATKTWDNKEEGLEESGKIVKLDKFINKKGQYTPDALAIIKLFTEENMFKGGVDHFSVENEIHKFLQHMIKEGFDFSPDVMYFRSHDISWGNNNTDWHKEVMKHLKEGKEWDSVYEYKSANASHEIWPYGDDTSKINHNLTRPGHWEHTYTTDADGNEVRSSIWVLAKEKLD